MNAMPIAYADLRPSVLVNIFKLADLLAVPPMKAAEVYFRERASTLPIPKEGTPADRTSFEGLPAQEPGHHPV